MVLYSAKQAKPPSLLKEVDKEDPEKSEHGLLHGQEYYKFPMKACYKNLYIEMLKPNAKVIYIVECRPHPVLCNLVV